MIIDPYAISVGPHGNIQLESSKMNDFVEKNKPTDPQLIIQGGCDNKGCSGSNTGCSNGGCH